MQRTATTKQDVEDLLRVEHGMYNWLRDTEDAFDIPREEFKSSYALDVIPFLRSGRTLCAILKILFPEVEVEPSTRTFLQMCRNCLNMDPDDLFTEADIAEITSLYDIIVSLMKIIDAIIDMGDEKGIQFPKKFNPPTDDRREIVSVEDELKYLHYVKIDVLDPTADDSTVSRVKGFDKTISSRTQSLMSNSTRSPMFEGGLDENFVDHIAENYAKDNPNEILRSSPTHKDEKGLNHLQIIDEFESSPTYANQQEDEHLKEFSSSSDIENNKNNEKEIKEDDDEEKEGNKLKLDINLDNVPAVEEVKSAKAVKLFKRTLSQDDFAILEIKCREEIERIKAQLEQLYEASKTEYFDIWRELLILSGKKHGLNHAQRFQEPMRNIKKAFDIELQKNRELKRKCIELRANYEASESKRLEVEAMIRRVEEENMLKEEAKSPSQVCLERLKKENKELKAERLNLDINITNQYNDMSRTVRTKNTSLINSSRSYINTSISFNGTANPKPKQNKNRNGLVDMNQPITAIEHTQKKLEVMKMYLEEEQAKSCVLSSNIDKLMREQRMKTAQIAEKKNKIAIMRRRMEELKYSARTFGKRKAQVDRKIRDIKTSQLRSSKNVRLLEAYNNMNMEMNRDIIDELDHDEKVLLESIEAKKKQLQELEDNLKEQEEKQNSPGEEQEKENNETNEENKTEQNSVAAEAPKQEENNDVEVKETESEKKVEEEEAVKEEVEEEEVKEEAKTEAPQEEKVEIEEKQEEKKADDVEIADDEVLDIEANDTPKEEEVNKKDIVVEADNNVPVEE